MLSFFWRVQFFQTILIIIIHKLNPLPYSKSYNIMLNPIKESSQQSHRRILMKTIFGHHSHLQLPINQAVILVSLGNDCSDVFEKISGRKLADRKLMLKVPFPQAHSMGKNLIIDGTERLLQPQFDCHFLTMHFLLKSVKCAKFIFVLHQSHTQQKPITTIKETFTRFVAMFNEENLKKLHDSCAVVINGAVKSLMAYINIIIDNGMLDKDYLQMYVQKEHIYKIAGQIKAKKRLVLWTGMDKTKDNIHLQQVINSLTFLPLADNSIPPAIVTNYHKYLKYMPHQQWLLQFTNIYNNLHLIVTHQNKDILQQVSRDIGHFQVEVADKHNNDKHSNNKDGNEKTYAAMTLSDFICKFLKIILQLTHVKMSNAQTSHIAMQSLIDILEEGNYLPSKFIATFFRLYYLTHAILTNGINNESDLMNLVFFDQKMTHSQKLETNVREMLLFLIAELEREMGNIQKNNKNYPFERLHQNITHILQQTSQHFKFAVPRINKKLKNLKATLRFLQAKTITKSKILPRKEHVQCWLLFLESAKQSPLIKQSTISQGFYELAQILLLCNFYTLAITCYRSSGLTLNSSKIRYIYQKYLKINSEIMRYLSTQQWKIVMDNFREYCAFMLSIGLVEEVKLSCLAGMQRAHEGNEKKIFKEELIRVRLQGLQRYQQFLQAVLQQEKIDISQDQINRIRQQMQLYKEQPHK